MLLLLQELAPLGQAGEPLLPVPNHSKRVGVIDLQEATQEEEQEGELVSSLTLPLPLQFPHILRRTSLPPSSPCAPMQAALQRPPCWEGHQTLQQEQELVQQEVCMRQQGRRRKCPVLALAVC